MPNKYVIKIVYDTESFNSIDKGKYAIFKPIIEQAGNVLTDIIKESHGYRIKSYNPDYDMLVIIKVDTLLDTTIASSRITYYANNNAISPDFPITQEITLNLIYINNNYFTLYRV